jgi:hypothetical protein
MFNVKPSYNDTQLALANHTARVRNSILHVLKQLVRSGLEDELAVKKSSAAAQLANRFYPKIHYCHNNLINAMKKGDVNQVKISGHKLINSLIEGNFPRGLTICSIGIDEWEDDVLGKAVSIATHETGSSAVAVPVHEDRLDENISHVKAALSKIYGFHPEMSDQIDRQNVNIKLFDGKVTQGLTDTRVFGEIYIRTPRDHVNAELYYVEHIVHEASHTYLNCLMASDPLLLNSPEEKFTSPLRADLRPMYGVYHATFVAARMALTFESVHRHAKDETSLKILAEVTDEAIRGLEIIHLYAQLTESGMKLAKSLDAEVRRISTSSYWENFNFDELRPHRCGAGQAKFSALKRAVTVV